MNAPARYLLTLALAGALAAVVAGCGGDADASATPKAQPRASRPAKKPIHDKPRDEAPEPVMVTGSQREHPFVAIFGRDGTTASDKTARSSSKLVLKAVFTGQKRAAIILSDNESLFVSEGDDIGGVRIVTISDGEVVVQDARGLRTLQLYER